MAHFILLTGLIGAGKSTVADLLRKKHYIVVDSDSRAKGLYNDPEVYHKAVTLLGRDILAADGGIDKNTLKERVFNPDERTETFLSVLADKIARGIKTGYESSYELVFVEAACTPQLNLLIDMLDVRTALFVATPDVTRYKRLHQSRGMVANDIERIDRIQRMAYDRTFYPTSHSNIRIIGLANAGNEAELLERLDRVLADRLFVAPAERLALYKRYLENAPAYCRDNAYCYSFYNMGGCKSCPFPCGRRTPLFERAEGLAAESDTAD